MDAYHIFVCGRTRTGKTSWAIQEAVRRHKDERQGVLFFNTDEMELAYGIKAWKVFTPRAIIEAVLNGEFVNYVPAANLVVAYCEACVLTGMIMGLPKSKQVAMTLIWDEAQELAPEHKPDSPLISLARRGAKRGISCIFTSQRPANVAKSVISQCAKHVIFKLAWEGAYFSAHGLPRNEILARLERATDHGYVIYDGAKLEGPFSWELDCKIFRHKLCVPSRGIDTQSLASDRVSAEVS